MCHVISMNHLVERHLERDQRLVVLEVAHLLLLVALALGELEVVVVAAATTAAARAVRRSAAAAAARALDCRRRAQRAQRAAIAARRTGRLAAAAVLARGGLLLLALPCLLRGLEGLLELARDGLRGGTTSYNGNNTAS